MVEIGLTGGIGAGKSSVATQLVDRGAVLIDADVIVRELQQPGAEVFDKMVAAFGSRVVGPDGHLDRKGVASLVFDDAERLAELNAIVHPAVLAEMGRRREEQSDTGNVVVLDIPLLVTPEGTIERPEYHSITAIVVVDVDPEVAVERLVEHRGFDAADARARMAKQATREARLALADFVIDNSGTPEDLAPEIDRCWAWIDTLR